MENDIEQVTQVLNLIDPLDVETTFVTISQLFNKNRRYVVPNYQRGYAWQDKHVNALWKDIYNIYDENKKSLEKTGEKKLNLHYMGVLAIDEQNKGTKSIESIFDIVDGQQRISTIIFLMYALIEKLEDEDKEILKSKYLFIEDDGDKIYKFDYHASSGDRSFLHDYIYNSYKDVEDKIDNLYKKNIYNAFINLQRKVENLNQQELKDFIEIIENCLVFNLYKNTQGIDAKKTFESMNNRGKELSKLELLKNRLIYLSTRIEDDKLNRKDDLIAKIDNTWKNIYYELGKNTRAGILKDDEFLKAHWIGYRRHFKDEKIPLGDIKSKGDSYAIEILEKVFVDSVYDDFDEIIVKPVTYKMINQYVQSLNDSAKHWSKLKNPKQNNVEDEEIKLLDRLSRIRNFIYVDALLLATLIKQAEIDTDKRLKLYKVLEKYIFINFGFKDVGRSNDMSFCNSFTQSLYVYDKKSSEKTPNELVDELIELLEKNHDYAIEKRLDITKENNLFEIIKTQQINHNYYVKMNQIRYLLYEYNKRYKNDRNYDARYFDWVEFKKSESIEHILPQSNIKFGRANNGKIARSKLPMSWQSVINRNKINNTVDNIQDDYDEDELIQITNSLGNLVAIVCGAKNSHLSNKSYAVKKLQYKQGTDREIEIVEKYPYWTVKEIYERTEAIFDFIYEEWLSDYIEQSLFNAQKKNMIGWTYDDSKNPHAELIEFLKDAYAKELTEEEKRKEERLEKQKIIDELHKYIRFHKTDNLIEELKDSKMCKKIFGSEQIVLKQIEIDKRLGTIKKKNKTDYSVYCQDMDKKIEINNQYYLLLENWSNSGLKKLKKLLETL